MLFTLQDREAKKDIFTFREIRLDNSIISTNPGIYIWKYFPHFSGKSIIDDLERITNLNFSYISQFEDPTYKIEVKKKHFKESSNLLGLSLSKENILKE
ncbi:MAG: hypothetical protein JJT78_04100, partial [Leptospira sp.]|nr:hypothetical protein [Leptospira sp.]